MAWLSEIHCDLQSSVACSQTGCKGRGILKGALLPQHSTKLFLRAWWWFFTHSGRSPAGDEKHLRPEALWVPMGHQKSVTKGHLAGPKKARGRLSTACSNTQTATALHQPGLKSKSPMPLPLGGAACLPGMWP